MEHHLTIDGDEVFKVEKAYYLNSILYVTVNGYYDRGGSLHCVPPYTMSIGGNHRIRPAAPTFVHSEACESELVHLNEQCREELLVEDFLL